MASKTSFEKSKIKILLLEGIHQSAVDAFKQAGYENVVVLSDAPDQESLKKLVADARLLGIRSRSKLDHSIFHAAEKLIAVGCFCIGTNQVDLDSALVRGIPVFNAPYSNTRSVAELVLAEAILLMRGIPQKNASAHRGHWLKSAKGSYEIRGKTIGIIGYGNIGTQVGVMAESLGMRVIFHDIANRLPLGNATPTDLSSLLETADVVTLHVPETPETKMMIGRKEIERMNPTSVLINASRGNVVDVCALAQAIRDGRMAGAAVDVFPREPQSPGEEFQSDLRGLDNVILTPHIGGSTEEAQENIGLEVAEKLIRYSDVGTTVTSVNFPEVALPPHDGHHRLLHIHHNHPGVLTAINKVFSDHQINIAGQFLQTNNQVGYVVIDIESDYSELARGQLQKIDGTIRCRVLW